MHFLFSISAVYLIAVMATSMLSLFATVLVLSLHYHDSTVPVPGWITRILLPNYTTKNDIISVKETNIDETEENEINVVDYLEMKKLKENKELSKVAVMQVMLLYSMLEEMKSNRFRGLSTRQYQEWKMVAKRLDRIFLYFFLFVLVLMNTLLLSLF